MTHLPLSPSAPQPSLSAALTGCAATFLPSDPPRGGRVAFWRPDGAPLGPAVDALSALTTTPPDADRPGGPADAHLAPAPGRDGQLPAPTGSVTVALTQEHDRPSGGAETGDARPWDDGIVLREVPAVLLPVAEALPLLTRARSGGDADPSVALWGTAAVVALQLVARGRLLPGLSPQGYDAWRLGPFDAADGERVRALAAAMPPYARAAPLPALGGQAPDGPVLLPEPERHLRAFLDAVADGLPRSPAAGLVTNAPAFAATAPQHIPEQHAWAADIAAGHDAGVLLSLRMEVRGPGGLPAASGEGGPAPLAAPGSLTFAAVLQVHSVTDPGVVTDAAEVWAGGSAAGEAFGARARMDTLVTLRRAAAVWAPLAPLLSAAVPDTLELDDEEVVALLGPAGRSLAAAGVQVHWPKELATGLTSHAVVKYAAPGGGSGPAHAEDGAAPGEELRSQGDGGAAWGGRPGGPAALLSAGALLSFSWRFSVGGQALDRAELDRLAEAGRPLVRLRDRWVLVDTEALRAARGRADRTLTPLDALGAALTGSAETDDGDRVAVEVAGPLAALRDRLADPEHPGRAPVEQPAALAATLRDYQLRGLGWLHQMTSLGLGCCLADDMGLGKTITLIALHLHRAANRETAGPTLVVCPTSLLGNWQREIEKFAPGTAVRRYHGARRSLVEIAPDEFVLTTYGTLRMDAARLAEAGWGLVVADEAQHVKNPASATARALRSVPSEARVALTGTPVENDLSELWAVLDWTTPGLLGPLGRFRTRYAQVIEGGSASPGAVAAAERLARLVRPFLLRRRKSDPGIAPELPPKTETDRAVTLTAEQAGLYEAVVREGLTEIAGTDGFARRGLVVKLLTSLKQICNHPAQYLKELDGGGGASSGRPEVPVPARETGAPTGAPVSEGLGNSPRIAGRSGKVELLDELLETLLAEEASVLVFTQYVQMARLLERHLTGRGIPVQLLHGQTPVARREEMVRRFQEGAVPVFLLSLKAAGTGLNLTRASHVVHFDRWWNPAVEAQATDRAYRIGQTQPVQVHRMITEGTVEDRIADMLARKQRLADAVLGSGDAALTELTDAELAELVTLRGEHG
ncbi:SNF2-related protein [Streptomyces sp. NPDC059080]|uniref:DEAD/DEAH box helicase n=1 Tax=Streptomyces sp. NPDC059080 TaxID=3346718 RepID=UPI00368072AE